MVLATAPDDPAFVARLKAGDERAFRQLVEEYHGRLARLARSFCRTDALIEEAVQETWLAVIKGISRFEGRSPLQSWLFGILANIARKMAVREKRHHDVGKELDAPITDSRDLDGNDEPEPGMGASGRWEQPPAPWGFEDPESIVLRQETLAVVERAIELMPESQRRVLLLRDVEGLASEDVCNILGVTGTNERVLLHRGRARVRLALDAYAGVQRA